MTDSTESRNGYIETRPAYDWRKRGADDARDGRFDPPAHPDDRAEYDAGRDTPVTGTP